MNEDTMGLLVVWAFFLAFVLLIIGVPWLYFGGKALYIGQTNAPYGSSYKTCHYWTPFAFAQKLAVTGTLCSRIDSIENLYLP